MAPGPGPLGPDNQMGDTMIRTTLVAVATAAALIVPVTGADAAVAERGTSIAGTWKGGVYGDNGAEAGYTAKVTLKKNAQGRWVGHGELSRHLLRATGPSRASPVGRSRSSEQHHQGPGRRRHLRVARERQGQARGRQAARHVDRAVRSGDSATMLAKKV